MTTMAKKSQLSASRISRLFAVAEAVGDGLGGKRQDLTQYPLASTEQRSAVDIPKAQRKSPSTLQDCPRRTAGRPEALRIAYLRLRP